MSDRWLVLAAVGTIAGALAVAVAQAGPGPERLSLAPNVPRVAASASIAGDSLTVTVTGAPAGARVDAAVDRLACGRSGYGLRPAGGAVADADGRARWTTQGALDGAVRDGRHVVAVGVGGTTIACGSIPSSRPRSEPARPRHWGLWSFARHFID